jgi:hypothetical protein
VPGEGREPSAERPSERPSEPSAERPSERADSAAERARRLHPAKRILLGTAGGLLLLLGVLLLVLPGPGLLLVLAGTVLLARAVPAVARFEEPVRTRATQAAEASVASALRIAGTVLTGLALIGAGAVWGARPVGGLPFAGWSTGLSLILSGLIVLGLLVWSHRRVHGGRTKGRPATGRADREGR